MKLKKFVAMLLALLLCTAPVTAAAAQTQQTAQPASDFYHELQENYSNEGAAASGTEARWWLPGGAHTDETIIEEITWLYNNGFRGFELCLLNTPDNNVYAYGSEAWAHDVKLAIQTATKLGMSVGLTSGTHWQAANIPGLDYNSEAAGQEAGKSAVRVAAGSTVTELTRPGVARGKSYLASAKETGTWVKQTLIGVYAYPVVSGNANNPLRPSSANPVVLDYEGMVDLTDKVVIDGDTWKLDGGWTAEGDRDYMLYVLAQQGNIQLRSPSQEPAYDINYYNEAGAKALQEFLSSYILADEELDEAIRKGDVQLFLDSLEINNSDGSRSMYWAEDYADEFMARKGYDIRPYLPLMIGISTGTCFVGTGQDVNTESIGGYVLAGADGKADVETTWRILNDFYDVQTQLIQDKMITPMQEWGLKNYNMPVRAQAPYGTYMEISEMNMASAYVETESLNMKDQTDLFRLWSGVAHIQDKLYSSETAGQFGLNYALTEEDYLRIAYDQFAGGINRTIWHGHSSEWGPDGQTKWPGFEGMGDSISGRLSAREPNAKDFPEMNGHLSRVQRLLREGTSRTDIGILHLRYGENTAYPLRDMNALREHKGLIWQNVDLQNAGYTYDYFSPEYLKLMDYDEDGLGENVRYQALIVHQAGLPLDNAKTLLELAKKGLPVLLMSDAAVISPYHAESDVELAAVIDEMKQLDNVKTIGSEAEALGVLESMGIEPRTEMVGGTHQLLSQLRQDGDNRYLFLYNYCDGTACGLHTPDVTQEVSVEGTVIPYHINSWTGDVERVAQYRYENGRTYFTVNMAYCTVELYAFEPASEEAIHAVSANGTVLLDENGLYTLRADASGEYNVTMSNGTSYHYNLTVPAARSLGSWDVTVEDWQAGEKINRTETGTYKVLQEDGTFAEKEVTTVEEKYLTAKTNISLHLDELKTWNNIPEVGKEVSGIGYYTTTFQWDASAASGAYLDLGWISQSATVEVNGQKADPVNSTDPVVDISGLLQDGENALKITVTAPLTNRLLAMGRLREGVSGTHTVYSIRYHENGLSSVTLVPYVDQKLDVVEQGTVNLTVSGQDNATVDAKSLSFEIKASGAEKLATATLTIDANGLVDPVVEAGEGWTIFRQQLVDGAIQVELGTMAGLTGDGVMATVSGGITGKPGTASVTVTQAVLSAYAGDSETFVAANLDNASARTEIDYSVYDVNRDGVVNQLDLTRAQRYYGSDDEICDVDNNGTVDIADLILILNNYSK